MDTIPRDVWPRIIGSMDAKTKRVMRLASQTWFNLIKYDNFTLYYTKKTDVPTIVDRLSKYSWPIKLTFDQHKFTSERDIVPQLSGILNLVELNVNFETVNYNACEFDDWMRLSTLTNMERWNFISQSMPSKFFSHFRKLKEWNYSGDDNEEFASELLPLLSDLTSLTFHVPIGTWPFALLKNPGQLTAMSITAAKTFDSNQNQMWAQLTNLRLLTCHNMFFKNHVDLKHLTALEKCRLSLHTLPSFEANCHTNLTSLSMQCGNWPKNNSDSVSNLKQLRQLTLQYYENVKSPNIVLTQLPELTELHLYNNTDEGHGRNLDEEIYQNLPPHLKVLHTTHSLDLAQMTHLVTLETIWAEGRLHNAEHFAHFSKLKKLQLSLDDDSDIRTLEQLTRLEELCLNGDLPPAKQVMNIEVLSALRSLSWNIADCPSEVLEGLKKLTNLELLKLTHTSETVESYEFLSPLTKMTSLSVRQSTDTTKNESLWINIVQLTNLKSLTLEEVGLTDDLLMHLTALQHMTELVIVTPDRSFTGCHLTALTSLKSLNIIRLGLQLKYTKEDLLEQLPYLTRYSEWV